MGYTTGFSGVFRGGALEVSFYPNLIPKPHILISEPQTRNISTKLYIPYLMPKPQT